jgi:CSLREA domain-containing protein
MLSALATGLALVAALLVAVTDVTHNTQAGSALFVNDDGDSDDGNCNPVHCTLREAINAVNLGQSGMILFNLAGCPDNFNDCTISPVSALPPITQPNVTIDATTHAGYVPGGPAVFLLGNTAGNVNGLTIQANGVQVKGLWIQFFERSGIIVSSPVTDIRITQNAIFLNDFDGITLDTGSGSIIEDNRIGSNGQAGVDGEDCPANTEIVGNSFTNHSTAGQAAVQICGLGNVVNFNRFSQNVTAIDDLGIGGDLDAENNWYGCNDGPGTGDCDPNSDSGGSIDDEPWLVLSLNASPATINVGETSTLTGSFRLNSDGADTSGLGALSNYIQFGINFNTDLGSFDGLPNVGGLLTDGALSATLTADGVPGIAHVSANADYESVSAQVTFVGPETPTPSPTASPTPTPSPTASPTPTPSGATYMQGDLNCDGDIDGVDGLIALLFTQELTLPAGGACPALGSGSPTFGDVTCDGGIDAADTIAILQFAADLPIEPPQPGDCTPLGQTLPS